MKKKIAIILLSVLIILTLAFIFGNSMKSKEASSEQSMGVYSSVIDYFDIIFGKSIITHNTFRKMAHFFEYFALGVEVFTLIIIILGAKIKHILYVLPVGLIVASIDETLQIFFLRGAMIKDVLLDFSGYIFSGVIFILIILIIKRKNKKAIS